MKRILTAAVGIPILLYTVWNDTPYFFAGLTTLAMILGLHEFYSLASRRELRVFGAGGYAAALVVAAAFVRNEPAWIVAAIAVLAVLSLGVALLRPGDASHALASA